MSGFVGIVAIKTQVILKLTIFWAGGNYLDMPPRTCTLVRLGFLQLRARRLDDFGSRRSLSPPEKRLRSG